MQEHMRLLRGVVALTLGVTVMLGAACSKKRVVTVGDGAPLAMTAAPPRVLAPVEEPLEATPAVVEVPAVPAPRTVAPPPVRRPQVPSAPAETEVRPEPGPPAPVQPDPARELRAAPSTADAAAERQVRDLLVRATRLLSRVDYRRLSAEGRSQYDQAKRFSDQAEAALRDRNFPFASTLADKAATLAAQLGG
jgi:hypothetical protein